MKTLARLAIVAALAAMVACIAILATDEIETVAIERPGDPSETSAERGELLLGLAGCVNCHTALGEDSPPLAGGRRLETPFGAFVTPNITSDPDYGVGAWTEEDFVRALRYGRRPDGGHYFPAFPYVAYTRLTDADMLAMWAAIRERVGIAKPNEPHEVGFPFNQRWTLRFWKLLHFEPGAFRIDEDRSAAWNRGAYISEALAHCGECHTPRWPTGGLDRDRWMAGVKDGPEGETAPNITPDDATGIGGWSDGDISLALKLGMKPDGDVVGSMMYEVIQNGTARLNDADIAAIVAYLKSLPPHANPDAPASQGF